jgi:prepilin-type processing-associated H-X9-DG protein
VINGEVRYSSWQSNLSPFLGIDWGTLAKMPEILVCPLSKPALEDEYAYNENAHKGGKFQSLGLGGSAIYNNYAGWYDQTPLPESHVRVPSDMLAFLDHEYDLCFSGFGWPGGGAIVHPDRRSNGVFCDGHTETSNFDPIPTVPFRGFKPTDEHAKRWFFDNDPHRELWPDWAKP